MTKHLHPPPQGQPPWYPGANGGVSFGTVEPANPMRGHLWWDGTFLWVFDGRNWVTDAQQKEQIEALMLEIYNDDPAAFRPPAVVNGTPAPPGQVGEIWSGSASGTWYGAGSASVAPLPNTVLLSPQLPRGDWNVQFQFRLPHLSPSLGVSMAMARLSTPLPVGAFSDMRCSLVTIPNLASPDGGLQPMILTSPTQPLNTPSNATLVLHLYVWPNGLMSDGAYDVLAWGRRVR